jgi:hypothetical protein
MQRRASVPVLQQGGKTRRLRGIIRDRPYREQLPCGRQERHPTWFRGAGLEFRLSDHRRVTRSIPIQHVRDGLATTTVGPPEPSAFVKAMAKKLAQTRAIL